MFRTKQRLLVVLVGAAALPCFLPAIAEAQQVRVGVGVSSGRGGYGGYGGYYGGYGPYNRGYGYYGGYGYPRSGVSVGIGLGAASFYAPGYGYAPLYTNRYYTPYVPVYVPYSTESSATYIVQPPPAQYPVTDQTADSGVRIEVRVPANAQVLFDGAATTQTGPVRRFVSPALTPGHDYLYTISATWTENNQPVTQARKLTVRAGGSYVVDLTGEALPEPKKSRP
jgi:uncharacterized protein (TIGR03000 family)